MKLAEMVKTMSFLLLATLCLPAAAFKCYHFDPIPGEVVEKETLLVEQADGAQVDMPCKSCKYFLLGGGFVHGLQFCEVEECKAGELGLDSVTGVVAESRCCYDNLCNGAEVALAKGLVCRSDMTTLSHIRYLVVTTSDPTGKIGEAVGAYMPEITVSYPCSQCVYGKKAGKVVGGTRTCWSQHLAGDGEACSDKVPIPGSPDEAALNVHLDEAVCCSQPNCTNHCNKEGCSGKAGGIRVFAITVVAAFLVLSFIPNL